MAVSPPGGLRRALIFLVFMFTGVFSYLYWNQVKDSVSTIHQRNILNSDYSNNLVTSKWVWTCINNHCERKEREESPTNGVSLMTCNMLCGSTQLWPQPTGPVTLASHSLALNTDQFILNIKTVSSNLKTMLNKAFDIFKQNLNALIDNSSSQWLRQTEIQTFFVDIVLFEENYSDLDLNTDESYNLTLSLKQYNMHAKIIASTFFGARHGLETLSQMFWWDDFTNTIRVLKGATVQDKPKFSYRGLMIDTARNYFSIDSLKRTIDGMAANKLNTFHWHISDSQSFPFDSPSVPQMAMNGAYGSQEKYREADVIDLVDYARVRGVRVLIEIDTPAHVGMGWTWGPQEGLGELSVCVGQQPWSTYCGEPPCGQLNPKNPNVYKILENLYSDILQLTGVKDIFHIGGDEVNLECWAQFKGTSLMNYNYSDLNEMWGDFTLSALSSLKRANKNQVPSTIIIWSSNLTKNPYLLKYLDSKLFVIQVWGSSTWLETFELLENDYRIIISHVDAWYLDCGFGRWRETGEGSCDPYRTWQAVYSHRPWHQMTEDKIKLILGGEACLWTEQVSEAALDTRLWPRVAAFAERLWSDSSLGDETPPQPQDQQSNNNIFQNIAPQYFKIREDTYTRIQTQSIRLNSRNIFTDALWPKWCAHNPGMCL